MDEFDIIFTIKNGRIELRDEIVKIKNEINLINLTEIINKLKGYNLYLFTRDTTNESCEYLIAEKLENYKVKYKGPIVEKNNSDLSLFTLIDELRMFMTISRKLEELKNYMNVNLGESLHETMSITNLSKHILYAWDNNVEINISNIDNESNSVNIINKSEHFLTSNIVPVDSLVKNIIKLSSTASKLNKEFENLLELSKKENSHEEKDNSC